MRIFKYRTFHQWAKSEKIEDNLLINAIHEMEKGLLDAKLGDGLYKKRIARKGQGKRGGYRMIIAFKQSDLSFFIYGYSKNEISTISEKEEKVYKKLAQYYLKLNDSELNCLIRNGQLIEVMS